MDRVFKQLYSTSLLLQPRDKVNTQTFDLFKMMNIFSSKLTYRERLFCFCQWNRHRLIPVEYLKHIPNKKGHPNKNITATLNQFVQRYDIERSTDGFHVKSMKDLGKPPSIHSNASRSGLNAEEILVKSDTARELFEAYFGKRIKESMVIKGGKKSDVIIHFEDGDRLTLQVKKGENKRGHHVDRRPISRYQGIVHEVLRSICMERQPNKTLEICKTQSMEITRKVLLGDDAEFQPNYFVHITCDDSTLNKLRIISTRELLAFLDNATYDRAIIPRSCLNLSPYLYIQRRGGDKSDSKPNDAQAKLKLTGSLLKAYTTLID